MGPTTILALLLSRGHSLLPLSGDQFWEETPVAQMAPGYHPMIRFGCWEITRFNRSTTYMFATPKLVQQGQFQLQGTEYLFHAVMANELENADIAHMVADMDLGSAQGLRNDYAASLANFEGSFDPREKILSISYPVNGVMRSYELHSTTEGDSARTPLIPDSQRGLVGLWHAPDPFPGKLDARTRTKIEEQGVQHFAKEASQSDGAQFSIVDLRVDGTCRIHANEGSWRVTGSTLTLSFPKGNMVLQISRDWSKLLSDGKVAYVRN